MQNHNTFYKLLLLLGIFLWLPNRSSCQNIKSFDSLFVTGYLIISDKDAAFYSTKDSIFDIDILKKRMKEEPFIKYMDPIDAKRILKIDESDSLKLEKNPFTGIFSNFFKIKFDGKIFYIYYVDRIMFKFTMIDLKGRKFQCITFPFMYNPVPR